MAGPQGRRCGARLWLGPLASLIRSGQLCYVNQCGWSFPDCDALGSDSANHVSQCVLKQSNSYFNASKQPLMGDCSSHDSTSGKAPLLCLLALAQLDLVSQSVTNWKMTCCTKATKLKSLTCLCTHQLPSSDGTACLTAQWPYSLDICQ